MGPKQDKFGGPASQWIVCSHNPYAVYLFDQQQEGRVFFYCLLNTLTETVKVKLTDCACHFTSTLYKKRQLQTCSIKTSNLDVAEYKEATLILYIYILQYYLYIKIIIRHSMKNYLVQNNFSTKQITAVHSKCNWPMATKGTLCKYMIHSTFNKTSRTPANQVYGGPKRPSIQIILLRFLVITG